MELKVKDDYLGELYYISVETNDQIITYDNKPNRDFNWGTVGIRHKKSNKTFMYYMFRGDKVPSKYKNQMDVIEEKWRNEYE